MAADLEIRIGAELSEIKAALASLTKDLSKVAGAAGTAGKNSADAFGGLQKSAGGAISTLTRLAAGLFSVAAAFKLIGAADELNTLNARLKLSTTSVEDFTRAQAELFQISQRTRSGLKETIDLYSRISLATKDAKVGQDTLLEVVETINQAVQLSGASTQAAEAALIQLGQGLASGTLRGEELNSILEQTPALADAIAKGIGVTRGELRKLGQDGKLSAEQVIKGLQAQRGEVQRQFAELPVTVGQSVTQVKNASLQLLGAFDTAGGATKGLAASIQELADFLSSDEVLGAVVEFATIWSNAFADIARDTQEALKIIEEATKGIGGEGEGLVNLIARAFKELPVNVRASIKIVTALVAGMADSFVADAVLMKEAFLAIFTDDTVEAAIARRNAKVTGALEAVNDSITQALLEREQALEEGRQIGVGTVAARRAARPAKDRSGLGKFKTTLTDEQRRKAEAERKAQLDAEARLEKDSADRISGILADYYQDNLIAAQTYYDARERIELAAVDKSIAIERKRLAAAKDPADRTKALNEIEILERSRTDIVRRADLDRSRAARALEQELNALRAQDLENQGRKADAAKIRAEAQYRDLLAKLEAAGNTAGVALVRKLIDTTVSQSRFDEIKAQFDKVAAELAARQESLENQRNTGALAPDTAQQQVVQARQQALEQLRAINVEIQKLAQDPNALPAVKEAALQAAQAIDRLAIESMTGLDAAMVSLRSQLANIKQGFEQATIGAGVDALTNLFTDLAAGSKSAGDAIRDFARSFVASMAQIASRALATYAILQLLDAIYPGAGKIAAGVGSAGVFHSGGIVGRGGRTRAVNPLLFAGAPRMHNGGMVGLAPSERPAILQTGEEVLSRTDPRNKANGGGPAGGTNIKIVNAVDPELAGEFFSTPAGETVFYNLISRNASQVRNLLGV